MNTARHLSLALGAVAAVLIAAACHDAASPQDTITAGILPGHNKGGSQCADFRLTGGGRVDKPEPETGKSPPSSHDFATFGFQARPDAACPFSMAGSGNIEWNEHLDTQYGGGFAFHGRVTLFSTPNDGSETDPQCGRFGGFGRLNPHNGATEEDVSFEVNHACDVDEPGVGQDHIYMRIGPLADGSIYFRHSLLSGGNIQWHRLTGNN